MDATTEIVSDELVEMMAILNAKVHGKSLEGIDNPAGFPLRDLKDLPLGTLLKLIDRLESHHLVEEGDSDGTMSAVLGAIDILKDWPNGYHAFLKRLGMKQEQSQTKTIGLRKSFESFYCSLFKPPRGLNGIEFMRQEFICFGLGEYGKVVVDNKLLREAPTFKRFTSKTEQAALLGIRPITLKKWGNQGLIPMRTVRAGSQMRYVIDSEHLKIKNGREGGTLGDRSAADFIGLPVSVLKSLRVSAHYEVRHIARRLKAFHEFDLNAFRDEMLSLGKELPDVPANCMSLGEVMRLKFRNIEGKADFMRNVLKNRIEVVGRIGINLKGLLFKEEQVRQFLRDKRAEFENGTWSLSEAAKFIYCDPIAIPTLIQEGLLHAVKTVTGRRVTEKSVRSFDNQYISIAKLAKELKTSSRRLQTECAKRSIPLKFFERGYGKPSQPFMARKYCHKL